MRHQERDDEEHATGYLNEPARVFAWNRTLTLAVVVLIGLQIWDSFRLNSVLNNWELILIPPHAAEREWVVGRNHVNETYLVDATHYIIGLWGNVSATTVEPKYNLLLRMFTEDKQPAYRERLEEIKNQIKKFDNISHTMEMREDSIYVKDNENVIEVHADRRKVIGDRLEPPVPVVVEIGFVVENGRFRLTKLDER